MPPSRKAISKVAGIVVFIVIGIIFLAAVAGFFVFTQSAGKGVISEAAALIGITEEVEIKIPEGDSGFAGSSDISGGGPPNKDDWNVEFEDDFTGSSLNTDLWEVGFGWGMDTDASAERISEEEISVSDGELHLTASHNGGPGSVTAGSVHTKGKHYYEPPVYFEARFRTPDRHGWLPAFWSKSNQPTPNWPPEIDFFEMLGNNPSASHHNIHFDASGGMGGNHQTHRMSYDGIESTTDYHVYGCAWYEDRIEMYVDGEHVGTHDDPTAMQSMLTGAPFYMMLNIHVGKTGQPDYSESWDETMDVDWVRVWKPK